MVMKSAEDGRRYDAAHVLDGAMDRSVFVERPISDHHQLSPLPPERGTSGPGRPKYEKVVTAADLAHLETPDKNKSSQA
jgi:hypothetical protein